MKLYVARHTQTNYNVQQLCNADPTVDVHLTDLGIQQAKQLDTLLAAYSFDIIYTSGLPRTRETANYLAQSQTTPILADNRLNDNASGFEGRPVSEYISAINASDDKWNVRLHNGESLAEAKQRVSDYLDELKIKGYSSVLIVCHGFIVECINAIINHLDFELASTFDVPQGEYRQFEITADSF